MENRYIRIIYFSHPPPLARVYHSLERKRPQHFLSTTPIILTTLSFPSPSRSRRHPISHPQIFLPIPIPIRLLPPLQRRPLRILLKQPHSLCIIPLIRSKTMINPRRHNHQIALFQTNSHPRIIFTAHIKIASPSENVANFFVFVQVFVEESFDFFFVVGE